LAHDVPALPLIRVFGCFGHRKGRLFDFDEDAADLADRHVQPRRLGSRQIGKKLFRPRRDVRGKKLALVVERSRFAKKSPAVPPPTMQTSASAVTSSGAVARS
jgi:hypothetical protein